MTIELSWEELKILYDNLSYIQCVSSLARQKEIEPIKEKVKVELERYKQLLCS